MAETQLVKEAREFLLDSNITLDKCNGKRSKTIIIVKNIPGFAFKEQLKELFEKFGAVKKLNFLPGKYNFIATFLFNNFILRWFKCYCRNGKYC